MKQASTESSWRHICDPKQNIPIFSWLERSRLWVGCIGALSESHQNVAEYSFTSKRSPQFARSLMPSHCVGDQFNVSVQKHVSRSLERSENIALATTWTHVVMWAVPSHPTSNLIRRLCCCLTSAWYLFPHATKPTIWYLYHWMLQVEMALLNQGGKTFHLRSSSVCKGTQGIKLHALQLWPPSLKSNTWFLVNLITFKRHLFP